MDDTGTASFARRLLLRLGASLAAALVYAIFVVLRMYHPLAYETLLRVTDSMPNVRPFGDLEAILQAGACWRDGVNVYVSSACMQGGVYNYSPFLLRAAYFPINPSDQNFLGIVFGAAFIAAFSLLPAPRSGAELLFRSAALCSGTVIWALEASNFDVVIFLLVLAGALLLLSHRWAALMGYALFIVAAACKFYPLVLLALVLRERFKQILAVAVLAALAGGVFMLRFAHGTAVAISILPGGLPFRGVFGALNIPFGLVLLRYLPVLTIEPNAPQYFAALNHPGTEIFIEAGMRCLSLLAAITAFVMAPRYMDVLRHLDPRPALLFMTGAMVIVFCFFVAQNLDYRGVFLLLTLPGGWAMAAQASGSARRRLILLLAFTMVVLWEGFFRDLTAQAGVFLLGPKLAVYPEIAFWLLRECLWWWIVVQLGAFLVCFVRISLSRLQEEIAASLKLENFVAEG